MASNEGCCFDLAWLNRVTVNAHSIHDSCEKEIVNYCDKLRGKYRAAWLLKAVSFLDLTSLSGDDTWSNTMRMALKAANPISENILNAMDFSIAPYTTAAVCVYPSRVNDVKMAINAIYESKELPVAAVSAGFPAGQFSLSSRLQEIQDCKANGAQEFDVVINRSLVLKGDWQSLYEEIAQMKQHCGKYKMKTILSVGELGGFKNIYKTSLVAMMAGSDFIKTSTGKENINANFPAGLVMMRAIQDYYLTFGFKVGFKAAGGIKSVNDLLNWMALVKKELGLDWLDKSLFRIGASSLLQEIERELYLLAFNRISAYREFTLV